MKRGSSRIRVLSCILCVLLLIGSLTPSGHAQKSASVAKHIILFVGDGMRPENEIAASRYLYGIDNGLTFHSFPYRSLVATWDVTVYNRQAPHYGAPPYSPSAVIPKVGCDAAVNGKAPQVSRKGAPRYACRIPEGAETNRVCRFADSFQNRAITNI